MKYTLKGNLHGAICADHLMPVSNTTVRLYRYVGNANEATALTAAQAKETFQHIDEKGIEAKKKHLLAETKTDKAGNYSFTIDSNKNNYNGEVVEFDVHYSKIPDYGQEDTKAPRKFKPFQVTLNVLQPRWRETNTGLVAAWNYRISHKLWCAILAWLDIWVICGIVLNCKSQQPLAGIDVTAMDDDWISDDELGTATTNAAGRFCVFYRSKDFKKTFLSPVINVETPLLPWGNGPDIYFKFSAGGSSLNQDEDPSRARKSDRENVGNCFCVRLCLDEEPREGIDAGFFGIGLNRRYNSTTNIDLATGKTTAKLNSSWNDLAFFGTMALLGTVTKKLNGNPMEYIFQYTELSNPTDPIPDPLNVASPLWNNVLPSQIANTVLGYKVVSISPYVTKNYAIHNEPNQEPVAIALDGWVTVPQEAAFIPNVNSEMIKLISENLELKPPVTTPDMQGLTPTGLKAGNSTISPPLDPAFQRNRYFVLRLKKREAGLPATEVIMGVSRPLAIFNKTYLNVPKGGSWAPNKVPQPEGVASLDLAELSSGGCSKITTTLNAKYTAACPNLGNVTLIMKGPGIPAINQQVFGPVTHSSPGEEAHGTLPFIGVPSGPAKVKDLLPCAYIVRLNVDLKMTNGEVQHHDLWDEVAFCK